MNDRTAPLLLAGRGNWLARAPIIDDSAGTKHEAHAIILATGASANYIGLESENRFKNMGVSASLQASTPWRRSKKRTCSRRVWPAVS